MPCACVSVVPSLHWLTPKAGASVLSTMDASESNVPHASAGSPQASWRGVLSCSVYTAIAHGLVCAGLMHVCLFITKPAPGSSDAIVHGTDNQLYAAAFFLFVGVLVAALAYNVIRKLYGLSAKFLWPDLRLLVSRAMEPTTRVASLITVLLLVFFLVQITTDAHYWHADYPNAMLRFCLAGILLSAWAWTWYLCARAGWVVCGVYAAQMVVIWIQIYAILQFPPWGLNYTL